MDVRGLMQQSATLNAPHRRGARRAAPDVRRGVDARTADGKRSLAAGLQPGDRVGVLEDNSIEAQDFFVGAAIAGLVRVPLYARNAPDSHHHMLDHTGCRGVVVSEVHAGDLDDIRDRLPALQTVLVRDDGYERWLAEQPATDPQPSISPDDWYIIRHTGGTTESPRGSRTPTARGSPPAATGSTTSLRCRPAMRACT